ncbi:MAG: WG repeat-containing protein [Bacteroidales bacterium]|nr:WG repeat-containing protein [Bacteroidales bacterium]
MKTRFTTMSLIIGSGLYACAQMGFWVVKPAYDNIQLLDNGLLKVSVDGKVGLLSADGSREVLPLENDSISPFKDGIALVYNQKALKGSVDSNGRLSAFEEGYIAEKGIDGYANGYLLVRRDGKYYFLDSQGEKKYGPYQNAEPFSEGFAKVWAYTSADDPEQSNLMYLEAGLGQVAFINVDYHDVAMLSTVHNGKGLVQVKKKFYMFDGDTHKMIPVSVDSTANKKSLITATKAELTPTQQGYELEAKNGKFFFDKKLRLTRIERAGHEPIVETFEEKPEAALASNLTVNEKEGKYGISYKEKEVLLPQFDQVVAVSGDLAVVRQNGKSGIVSIKDNPISIRLNKGQNIGFMHEYYETPLTITLPAGMQSAQVVVGSLSPDCEIESTTRTDNENAEGSTINYLCRLKIPAGLADTLSLHKYDFCVQYDGLRSSNVEVEVPMWYAQGYKVDLTGSDYLLGDNEILRVEFDLVHGAEDGAIANRYYKNVELTSATHSGFVLEKITEDHYGFQLAGIPQENVNFNVRITEKDCPPVEYPFMIIFDRPAPDAPDQRVAASIKPLGYDGRPLAAPLTAIAAQSAQTQEVVAASTPVVAAQTASNVDPGTVWFESGAKQPVQTTQAVAQPVQTQAVAQPVQTTQAVAQPVQTTQTAVQPLQPVSQQPAHPVSTLRPIGQ